MGSQVMILHCKPKLKPKFVLLNCAPGLEVAVDHEGEVRHHVDGAERKDDGHVAPLGVGE